MRANPLITDDDRVITDLGLLRVHQTLTEETMNYRELAGMALCHEWAAKMKTGIDEKNAVILAERQRAFDRKEGIRVGDFVTMPDGSTQRVAHHWGDSVQLTDGRFGSSFYFGDGGYCDFSGGLNPGIDITRFILTDERRAGSVWFFSENYVTAHNGYHCEAMFRVWSMTPENPKAFTLRVDELGKALQFISDSQDVEAIKGDFPGLADDYDSFFVLTGDGDYIEVWGMHGIVPVNSRMVARVK